MCFRVLPFSASKNQDEKASDVPNGEGPECDADGLDGTQLTSLQNPTPEVPPRVFFFFAT